MLTSGYPSEASLAVASAAYGVGATHDAFHMDQGMGHSVHHASCQQHQEGMLPCAISLMRVVPSYSFIKLLCLLSGDCLLRFLALRLLMGAVPLTRTFPAYSANEVSTLSIIGSLSAKLLT